MRRAQELIALHEGVRHFFLFFLCFSEELSILGRSRHFLKKGTCEMGRFFSICSVF